MPAGWMTLISVSLLSELIIGATTSGFVKGEARHRSCRAQIGTHLAFESQYAPCSRETAAAIAAIDAKIDDLGVAHGPP